MSSDNGAKRSTSKDLKKKKGLGFFKLSEAEQERILGSIDKLLSIIRGRVDVKSRLMLLLNPENLQTSTRLSKNQVDFVSFAYWIASQWNIFNPLKAYATEFMLSNISLDGLGRKEAIEFVQALEQLKIAAKSGLEIKEGKEGKKE